MPPYLHRRSNLRRSKRSSGPRAFGIGLSFVCFLSFQNVYFPWCGLLLFSHVLSPWCSHSALNLAEGGEGAAIEPDLRAGTADRNWRVAIV